MATLNGIISKLNGSAGQLTFKRTGGQTIVSEKITQTTNRRTSAQQKQRMKWANIVAMYKGVSPLLNMAFENKAAGVSDFNMFMKLNLQNTPVYLTKSEVAASACVAAPYQITQGSLNSIVLSGEAGASVTDIKCGIAIDENTTIAAFSNAVVSANSGYSYGDQISFIYAIQSVDALTGAPKCEFYGEAILLDKSSEVKVLEAVSARGFSVSGGYLAGNIDFVGCYAWVHSRKSSGKTLVSPQVLVNYNEDVYNEYIGDAAYQRAVATYGGENDNFLTRSEQSESGDTPVTDKVKLTLTSNDESLGTVSPAGTTSYAKGTSVTIKAIAGTTGFFKQWSDGNTNAERTIVMDEDTTLEATFQ